MKIIKRKKQSRMHGHGMGTHGGGARKKRKGSGHRGGKGMSGSGKRADHKKTLVNKLYGHKYFGKQGITSRGTKRDTRKKINLRDIELNFEKYKTQNGNIDLKNYKILGTGEITKKLIIKAKEASASAIKKVKKAGGEIILIRSQATKNEERKVKEKVSEKKEMKEKNTKSKEKEQTQKGDK